LKILETKILINLACEETIQQFEQTKCQYVVS
jgi:hypothetical protein